MKLEQIDNYLVLLRDAKPPPPTIAQKLWRDYEAARARSYRLHDTYGRKIAQEAARLVRLGLRRAKVRASIEIVGRGWNSGYDYGKSQETYKPYICLKIWPPHGEAERGQIEVSCHARSAAEIAAWARLTAARVAAWLKVPQES